jgi:hypothetical protein
LWYSIDSFLYRLINKGLREQDVEALYSLRFYLGDLHEEISRLHSRFLASSLNVDLLNVYRGLGILTDDFTNLQTKIGGFISTNSFLSILMLHLVSLFPYSSFEWQSCCALWNWGRFLQLSNTICGYSKSKSATRGTRSSVHNGNCISYKGDWLIV